MISIPLSTAGVQAYRSSVFFATVKRTVEQDVEVFVMWLLTSYKKLVKTICLIVCLCADHSVSTT